MLKYSPKDRFGGEACLSHKWFKKNEKAGSKLPSMNSTTISNIKKFHVLLKLFLEWKQAPTSNYVIYS